jgi:hypothetical protein
MRTLNIRKLLTRLAGLTTPRRAGSRAKNASAGNNMVYQATSPHRKAGSTHPRRQAGKPSKPQLVRLPPEQRDSFSWLFSRTSASDPSTSFDPKPR